jgi:hypothetical protein
MAKVAWTLEAIRCLEDIHEYIAADSREAAIGGALACWAAGTFVRASDTAWAKTLSPADRLAIVEDLFGVAYAAHERAGDWGAVDDLAWRETLAERRRLAAAFHRLDEVQRGCTPLADAG